jgi:PAS domain S-box-containing protein
MNDDPKSKEQLIHELTEARRLLAELEAAAAVEQQAETALKEELAIIEQGKQEWEVTADSLPQLICLVDHEGQIIRANRTIETWGLAQVDRVKERTIKSLFAPASGEYLELFWQQAREALTQGAPAEWEVEDEFLRRYLHIQVQPLSRHASRHSHATESMAALILHDITERKLLERLKNEFLAHVNQEMEVPLTLIIARCQDTLAQQERLTPPIREDVQAICENGQQLYRLVNEILDLAEFEAGSLTLTPEPVELEPLLRQLQTTHAPLLAGKPIEFGLEIASALPPIEADRGRLEQLLNHLVTNAIKFTEQGRINLYALADDNSVFIKIEDTGIGIGEEYLEIIFEKFRQVDGSLSRRATGAGLGLALVRYLVQLHGGDIGIRSQVGKGTTVTVHLPIKHQAKREGPL